MSDTSKITFVDDMGDSLTVDLNINSDGAVEIAAGGTEVYMTIAQMRILMTVLSDLMQQQQDWSKE